MAYALVGYFDNKTDTYIRSLWKELADNNICDYLHKSENNPHIKFSMFTQLDVEVVKPILSDFTRREMKIGIHLKNYGFYATDNPTVCIDISPSVELVELENNIRSTFNEYGERFDFQCFDKNIWMPSCQLTVRKEKSNVLDAVNLLLKRPLQFNGTLERIGIIEFHPAKQIVSYDLK